MRSSLLSSVANFYSFHVIAASLKKHFFFLCHIDLSVSPAAPTWRLAGWSKCCIHRYSPFRSTFKRVNSGVRGSTLPVDSPRPPGGHTTLWVVPIGKINKKKNPFPAQPGWALTLRHTQAPVMCSQQHGGVTVAVCWYVCQTAAH